jgi:hypothetical protein
VLLEIVLLIVITWEEFCKWVLAGRSVIPPWFCLPQKELDWTIFERKGEFCMFDRTGLVESTSMMDS